MIANLALKAIGPIVILGALAVGGFFLYQSAKNAGYQERAVEQLKSNTEAYDRIKEKVQNEDIDVSDPDIVDCLLRELAGTLPEGEECGDL